MSSIAVDRRSPTSLRELGMSLDYGRADTKRSRETYMEPRVRTAAIDNVMAHRSHSKHRSGPSTKRHRCSEEDLQGFGAWCEPIASPQQQVFAGSSYNYEDASQSTRSRRDSISIAPSTPRDRLLPMPELSPLPTHFVFCPCCVDEEGRINETWHMAGPEKMETQLEYAMAYIERMKSA
ncbi:hypothetical protein M419DRAFT_23349 [Trichoderma reesei RUT C-30]|uniref:Uncharacterized protein n=1 Tax=Hypocrea jecorina (strain ATCC 56765 / BCRC 32924 / NRRL 11460 / Rut C-30) TaxID=1344414 RepID=A0A024SMZ5_HYPJR|nr:hypothetical protein M419DRAFT_23349 [Trichoderma reesei RUT C-30]